MVICIERTASAGLVAFWSVMPFTERKSFIRPCFYKFLTQILFESSPGLFLKYSFNFASVFSVDILIKYILIEKERVQVTEFIYLFIFYFDKKVNLFILATDCFYAARQTMQLLKLINYSCSSYPTRAPYSAHVDGFNLEPK